MFAAQMALGWCFPNAVMQYAVPDLEALSSTWRRSRPARPADGGAERGGYEVLPPEGTFYLFGRWPAATTSGFWNALADRDVFVLPGRVMNAPGYFRASLTASTEMIERALPVFAEVAAERRD